MRILSNSPDRAVDDRWVCGDYWPLAAAVPTLRGRGSKLRAPLNGGDEYSRRTGRGALILRRCG
jgi:hypothetical protein